MHGTHHHYKYKSLLKNICNSASKKIQSQPPCHLKRNHHQAYRHPNVKVLQLFFKNSDSPKKPKKNATDVIANIVYELHQGNVATYYVDPSTTIRPFYNNIRREITNKYGPLRELGILGIASLAQDPPSNVPLYRAEDNITPKADFLLKFCTKR
jgi:hypothetical protein